MQLGRVGISTTDTGENGQNIGQNTPRIFGKNPHYIMRGIMHFAMISAALVILANIFLSPLSAQQPQNNHIATQLISESETPAPGKIVTLALVMTPDTGWHGYWENPGDAGFGMTIDWTLPKGVTIGKMRYPVPHRLSAQGIMNYVYEGEYVLLMDLKIDENFAANGALPIKGKGQWLACTDELCVPEAGELSLNLTTGNGHISGAAKAQFNGYREKIAPPLGSIASYHSDGDIFRMSIPFPKDSALDTPYFFALTDGIVDYSAAQKITRDDNNLYIETKARGAGNGDMTGMLKIAEGRGLNITAKAGNVTIPAGAELVSAGDGETSYMPENIWMAAAFALGGAFLGGLLLNIMPCVFPILSLKAMSVAKAGGDKRAVRRDALAYTAGILVFCLALGGLMLGLRAFGQQIGWGFQLQNPAIIMGLILLFTAISLNLAGLFELGNISMGGKLASQSGSKGAFWTGALAALVATPCSAPFMAGAIGTAIILPFGLALMVFVGLGLGLALPFLAIAYIPGMRERLPKPGPWMDNFRKIMAIPMLLSLLALLWLLGQQLGTNAIIFAVGAAMILGMFLWLYGIRQHKGKSVIMVGIAALILSAASIWALPQSDSKATGQTGEDALSSVPYDAQKLADYRAKGTPVFAYFTADWCITCKANEAAAVNRQETANAFANAGVVAMKGDWTLHDADITAYLEEHGRSGVPLYVYYAPGKEAQILPQILTVGTLTELVE